jgi:hypothetical protein
VGAAQSLASWGSTDFFLAKYNGSGANLWARSSGGPMADSAKGVTVDAENNPLITGQVLASVDFGAGWVGVGTGKPAYVAKYSPTGTYIWSSVATEDGISYGTSLASDAQGNIVMAGSFSYLADFGDGVLNSPWGTMHGFLVRYKK